MSLCPSLSNPYKLNTNIVHDDHPPNNFFNFDIHKKYTSSLPKPNTFSLRRTLSADMSSQKWLENNDFTLKKTRSSEHLQSLGGGEDYGCNDHVEKDYEQESNDEDHNKGASGGAAFEDIWSCILTQKKLDGSGSGQLPPPYIHPLVKRSASSLSEKSLEICTESLGSETGSDGFSHPTSEGNVDSKEEVEVAAVEVEEQEDTSKKCNVEEMRGFMEISKYNYGVNKKIGPPKSFPPPLPSLAHRNDGSNVHMRTQRKDGRLVLEAVSVPSQNCFRAQRQDGRLLLVVTRSDQQLQEEVEDCSDEEMEYEDDEEEEDVGGNVEELAFVMEEKEKKSTLVTNGVISVQRPSTAMIMSKLIELTSTRNSATWPRNFNKTVIKSLDEEEVGARPPTLPPRPKISTTTAAKAALNTYEYNWRSQTAAAVAVLKQNASERAASPQVVKYNNNNMSNNNNNNSSKILLAHNGKGGAQEVVLVKAAAVGGVAGEKREYLVPLFRGCKEPRRSLLFWEPYCIATS